MPWKIRRYSRWKGLRRRAFLLFIVCLLILAGFQIGSRARVLLIPVSRQVIGAGLTSGWQVLYPGSAPLKTAMAEVLPVASLDDGQLVEDEASGILITAIQDMTAVNFLDPKTFFDAQVAHFDAAQPVTAEPEVVTGEEEAVTPPPAVDPSEKPAEGKPLVALYCTHNAESYVSSQGAAKIEGKNGGVYQVAESLKKALEDKYKITAVLDPTLHDYPDWRKSYTNSLVTLEKIKAAYPSVQMFIDVHRDATTTRESTTVEIKGEKAAKLMFIVGSDTRLPHPNWQENRQYANRLAHAAEILYPGLVKGVRVQDGRYNQHVSPHCLLLEVGGTENSLEEAKRSASLLADAINLVVNDLDEQE